MSDDRRRTEFYSEDERRALSEFGANRDADPALENRIVGVLRRRGMIETPHPVEPRTRFGAAVLGFLKPALVGAAVVSAFVIGRSMGPDEAIQPGTLVNLVPGDVLPEFSPSHLDAPESAAATDHADGAPQRLVVLGSEDRRYEYYVDDEGKNYYVLVKLPIPTPITSRDTGSEQEPRVVGATAQTVPGRSDSRFEYYFDTHGNAYGVVARDHPAADLFATR